MVRDGKRWIVVARLFARTRGASPGAISQFPRRSWRAYTLLLLFRVRIVAKVDEMFGISLGWCGAEERQRELF